MDDATRIEIINTLARDATALARSLETTGPAFAAAVTSTGAAATPLADQRILVSETAQSLGRIAHLLTEDVENRVLVEQTEQYLIEVSEQPPDPDELSE